MSEPDYRWAERLLNETVTGCSDENLEFRIHFWGMVWQHHDNPVHRHSFYEVCYVLGGTGEYEVEGRTYELANGSQFLSLPGHWHQIRSISGLQLFYVAFELGGGAGAGAGKSENAARHAYEAALSSGGMPVTEDHENGSALLWRALYRLTQQEDAGRVRTLAGLLLSSFAVTFGHPANPPSAERAATRSSSQLVQLAKRYIRDNVSRPIKLEDVASYLHISDRHLSRIFRRHGGETFGQYLARERMQMAEARLKTTVLTVKEIAEETGFRSVHYFTRAFTAHFGMPPASYRRQSME